MNLGITGTRHGASKDQLELLALSLEKLFSFGFRTLHHGDCVGVDQQAAEMAKKIGYNLFCHPPESNSLRAYVESDDYKEPKGYLERDRCIVDSSQLLIAVPNTNEPAKRSGTWYTYRYALSKKIQTILIKPDCLSQTGMF